MVLDDDIGDPGFLNSADNSAVSLRNSAVRPATVGISTTFSNRSRSAWRRRRFARAGVAITVAAATVAINATLNCMTFPLFTRG